ncbi:hypothetical protein EOPP23_17345 [Endozoicomonas sp. OPT23]|uniref:hypothetical protein n=1 Tax=Endozoicomonas sp. OPT23 TaxID=2072845 RepID=UPI00129A3285|nr:hypothetical protein [Endozoicomonas sp. OPT23]MRI34750.1 hypothetical protein [Endozoicomonas sp. OPT23]
MSYFDLARLSFNRHKTKNMKQMTTTAFCILLNAPLIYADTFSTHPDLLSYQFRFTSTKQLNPTIRAWLSEAAHIERTAEGDLVISSPIMSGVIVLGTNTSSTFIKQLISDQTPGIASLQGAAGIAASVNDLAITARANNSLIICNIANDDYCSTSQVYPASTNNFQFNAPNSVAIGHFNQGMMVMNALDHQIYYFQKSTGFWHFKQRIEDFSENSYDHVSGPGVDSRVILTKQEPRCFFASDYLNNAVVSGHYDQASSALLLDSSFTSNTDGYERLRGPAQITIDSDNQYLIVPGQRGSAVFIFSVTEQCALNLEQVLADSTIDGVEIYNGLNDAVINKDPTDESLYVFLTSAVSDSITILIKRTGFPWKLQQYLDKKMLGFPENFIGLVSHADMSEGGESITAVASSSEDLVVVSHFSFPQFSAPMYIFSPEGLESGQGQQVVGKLDISNPESSQPLIILLSMDENHPFQIAGNNIEVSQDAFEKINTTSNWNFTVTATNQQNLSSTVPITVEIFVDTPSSNDNQYLYALTVLVIPAAILGGLGIIALKNIYSDKTDSKNLQQLSTDSDGAHQGSTELQAVVVIPPTGSDDCCTEIRETTIGDNNSQENQNSATETPPEAVIAEDQLAESPQTPEQANSRVKYRTPRKEVTDEIVENDTDESTDEEVEMDSTGEVEQVFAEANQASPIAQEPSQSPPLNRNSRARHSLQQRLSNSAIKPEVDRLQEAIAIEEQIREIFIPKPRTRAYSEPSQKKRKPNHQ